MTPRLEGLDCGSGPLWRAVHRESGGIVADPLFVARTFADRLRGWIGRRRAPGEGLWLPRCACIHTAGLRMAIDVIWCGPDGTIIRIDRCLPPWRIAAARSAEAVCEVVAGAGAGLAVGDHVDVTARAAAERLFCYYESWRSADGGRCL